MNIRRHTLTLVAAFGLVALARGANPAEQWPQWRGPHLNGSSDTARDLPVSWSETENVLWRVKLPSWSAATPIIWEDTVFVTSAEEGFTDNEGGGFFDAAINRIASAFNSYDGLLLVALDRSDGALRWQRPIGDGNKVLFKQNMASPSPVTDGKNVWVMTGTGYLTAFDFDGEQVWQRNIQEDYGEFGLGWGYASSPTLHQGHLYIQVLHGNNTDDPSYLLKINAATGKTVWRVERPTDAVAESPDSYSTPMLAEVDGALQLVIAGGDYLTGHDIASGKELWRAGGLNPNKEGNYRTIPSALISGDMIFAPSRRRPFIGFRKGAGAKIEKVWSTDYGPDVPTPVTDGERVYIVDDRGIVICLRNADGTTVWDRSRLEPGTYSASPVLADGKIYATSEAGTTTVFAAGDEFKILSVNKLNDFTLSSPAVSGKQVFIRTREYLYCLAKSSVTGD